MPFDVRAGALESALGPKLVPADCATCLLLLMRRRRLGHAGGVAADFRRLYNRRAGIVEATASSAAPLSEDEVRTLRERIASHRRRGPAGRPAAEVDPSLLGGVTVRLGDTLIDGSVRGRLERLRSQLAART